MIATKRPLQVVYLVHGRLDVCQAVAQHVKMCQRWGHEKPQLLPCCRRLQRHPSSWPGSSQAALLIIMPCCRQLPCSALPPRFPLATRAPPPCPASNPRSGGARGGHHFDFCLLMMPRRTQVAERILEEQGILGDVALRCARFGVSSFAPERAGLAGDQQKPDRGDGGSVGTPCGPA